MEVHPNGVPSAIHLHENKWDTTSCYTLKRIYLDVKGNRIDHEINYERGDNGTIPYYDRDEGQEFLNLQDELEYLQIRAGRFATEEQFHSIRLFRYRWMGLLDRIPLTLNLGCLIPYESTGSHSLYYELRSQPQEKLFHKKFDELMEFSKVLGKERRYPVGCPSLIRVLNWNKTIYELVQEYKNKHWSKAWVDGEYINICKYLALKYTFKKKWKSPSDIFNSFSQAQHRASKIAKPLL